MKRSFVALIVLFISGVGHIAAEPNKDTCPRNAAVVSTRFDPSGKAAQLLWSDGLAQVYDLDTGTVLSSSQMEDIGGTLLSVTWSPNGKDVLVGTQDGNVHEWDFATGKTVWKMPDPIGNSPIVAWSPDGTRFLIAAANVRVWDAKNGKLLRTIEPGAYTVAWSSDSKMILTGNADDAARIYDADSGNLVYTLPGHSQGVWSAAWSPSGNVIVSTSQDGMVYLWQAGTGLQLEKYLAHEGMIRSVAWSPNGQQILTGGDDQTARTWEPFTGLLFTIFRGHTNVIWSVEWSPNGQTILTGDLDGTARLWDANTGKLLRSLCSPAQ